MATQIKIYDISTDSVADLENNEICSETVTDSDLGFKMWGGKDNAGTVTRFLCKDENAQVADLTVTGDISTLTGSVAADSMSNAGLNAEQLIHGDFAQATTLFWKGSKLRIGSTNDPAYMVDIESTSADQLRLVNSNADTSHPLQVFYKDSASPGDNDGIGQQIFRGKDGNESTPGNRDFVTISASSPDVSAVIGKYLINILGVGEFIYASTGFSVPVSLIFGERGGLEIGEIYVDNNSTGTDLALQDTYYQIAIFDANGESKGLTPDHTNNHITANRRGRHLILCSITAQSAASNAYYFTVFKNGGTTEFDNLEAERQTTTANKPGSISISGAIQLNKNDTVELWVQRTDGGGASKTILVTHVTMTVIYIGGWS